MVMQVSKMKSPTMKQCRNPDCDYYFYTWTPEYQEYCSRECQMHVYNLTHKEEHKEWRDKQKSDTK
jgi:hypothetical protein